MATSAPIQTFSFGGNPATGEAPSSYNVTGGNNATATRVATAPNVIASPTTPQNVANAATSATNTTTTSPTTASTGVIGNTSAVPKVSTPTGTTGSNSATAGIGGGNNVTDPTTGQQTTPSEAAFNSLNATNTPPPQDSASGSAAVSAATAAVTPPQPAPTPQVISDFVSNNPAVADQAQQLQNYLNPQSTQDQLTQELININTDQTTLSGLNTQYMNIENIMTGTEDDIRNEIQAAGGMATNSQVMALTSARNKVLLQQAKTIQDAITNQKNIVSNDTSLYTKDKAAAQQEFTDRSDVLKLVDSNQKSVDTAQKTGAQLLLKTMGAAGVYASLSQDPTGQAVANFEQALGLPVGSLQQMATTNDNTGTVSIYETDPTGLPAGTYKTTIKNGQITSRVQQKGKTPKAQTATQIKNDSINGIDTYLSAQTGEALNPGKGDAYVSPQTYQKAKAAWVKDGLSAVEFDSKFSKYANPADLQDYRASQPVAIANLPTNGIQNLP